LTLTARLRNRFTVAAWGSPRTRFKTLVFNNADN
jgi:hypothetical protein